MQWYARSVKCVKSGKYFFGSCLLYARTKIDLITRNGSISVDTVYRTCTSRINREYIRVCVCVTKGEELSLFYYSPKFGGGYYNDNDHDDCSKRALYRVG